MYDHDCPRCERILENYWRTKEVCDEHNFDADAAYDFDKQVETYEEKRRQRAAERNEW